MNRSFCKCALIAMACIVLCSGYTHAQPSRGFSGFLGLRSSMLIDMPEVRIELKTEDDQDELLVALAEDLSDQRRAVFSDNSPQRPPNADWFEQLQAKLTAFDRRSEELVAVVLEPDQSKRLAELRLQREGSRAFHRPEVQAKLELTDEQKKSIDDALKANTALQFGPTLDFRQRREQREKQEQTVISSLTGEQKSRWEEMKGKPFRFPTPRRPRRR